MCIPWENGFTIPNHSNYICNVSYLFSERLCRLGFPSSLVSYMGREGHNFATMGREGHSFATDLLTTNMMGQGVGREWW